MIQKILSGFLHYSNNYLPLKICLHISDVLVEYHRGIKIHRYISYLRMNRNSQQPVLDQCSK